MNIHNINEKIASLAGNFLSRRDVVLISEQADWAIKEISLNIQHALEKNPQTQKHSFRLSYSPLLLRNSVVHFASINTLIRHGKPLFADPSNQHVLTWFHTVTNDKRLRFIPQIQKHVAKIHTACQMTKQQLQSAGIAAEKIHVIPLGTDTTIFRPLTSKNSHENAATAKQELRQKLHLPTNKYIIGSFQKDGDGWGEGMTPKLIKGPDIFCDVVEKLAKTLPIHVLLTGPARGYVKNRLKQAGITYSHHFLSRHTDTVPYFQALDLYIIASRIEGGPQAILEAWATGIPIVSTKVGMVPDISENGKNIMLAKTEDRDRLYTYAGNLLSDNKLAENLANAGLKEVQKYSWEKIASRYFQELYQPLFNLKNQ